ncbi:MAG: nickel-dependent lactate racemase [Verrucomicrobia bacterium]|nr:nickel-dependent lactate racemase [Verrucomicrobiota bacterium]MDA1065554.1 nickel-dependent lactate racemase [Verrucomicrobiota bacterium]
MHTILDYGQSGLKLELTGLEATILSPKFLQGLADEGAAFKEAINDPIGCPPLKEIIRSNETVAIVIPDITRALPNERLLTWLFKELAHLPAENYTIISGTGTHRENTEEEWEYMVGKSIYRNYRCINHNGFDFECLTNVGKSRFGYDVYFNSEYLKADRRILMGFIEPHFMAGFSGGFKAALPGVTGVDTIMKYHSAENIGHPGSTWGNLDNNPTQENVQAGGSLIKVDFLINVTLNNKREITGYFLGDPFEAHKAGCEFCKETAMIPCDEAFDIVVTSNSGYPLDQNLYQAVKGMSAAAQILKEGGLIISAARCNDGFPDHGNFKRFLFEHDSPQAMLDKIYSPGFELLDQWQVQLLAIILLKGRVGLFSILPDEMVTKAHMIPVSDIRTTIDEEIVRLGRNAKIAILPEGPLTIPYLA